MKRRTVEHPKFHDLQAALGCTKAVAVGTLELLWHFASDFAPAGDVGRYRDEQLARSVGYDGDAAHLVRSLVASGWLDESLEHRLIVHDWSQHCDDYVHLRLARSGQRFADGTMPKLSRLTREERANIEAQGLAVKPAPPPPALKSEPKPEPKPEKREPRRDLELDWRIDRCWQTFLDARARFLQSEGSPVGRGPAMTPEIREAIRAAIKLHDADLLLPLDRDRWESESRALAAGEGIFLSPWHTGRDPQNPKRFLEPWRPWKPQRGKPDPVEGFAELAFADRRRREPLVEFAEPVATIPLDDAPIWKAIRERLRARLHPDEFRTWIDPLDVIAESDGVTVLAAPNGRFVHAVEENYREAIDSEAYSLRDELYQVLIRANEMRRAS